MLNANARFNFVVSTHSRAEAAAFEWLNLSKALLVSTHSRAEAAARKVKI